MSEARKPASHDAMALIALRNEFYQKRYHLGLALNFLCLFVICVLIGMLSYLVKHPPRPLYFATDNAGRFILDVPLQKPNMSDEDVAAWVVDALENTYSYDFINFHAQLQNSQKYFTDYGWRTYMKGLQASNNLIALTNRKMISVAKVISQPKLVVKGPVGKAGVYGWKFQVQLLVTYLMPPAYDDTSKFSNPLVVSLIVQRQSALSSYKGLGIVQLIGALAQATPTQNLTSAPS